MNLIIFQNQRRAQENLTDLQPQEGGKTTLMTKKKT